MRPLDASNTVQYRKSLRDMDARRTTARQPGHCVPPLACRRMRCCSPWPFAAAWTTLHSIGLISAPPGQQFDGGWRPRTQRCRRTWRAMEGSRKPITVGHSAALTQPLGVWKPLAGPHRPCKAVSRSRKTWDRLVPEVNHPLITAGEPHFAHFGRRQKPARRFPHRPAAPGLYSVYGYCTGCSDPTTMQQVGR
jgi:hypothetical protein